MSYCMDWCIVTPLLMQQKSFQRYSTEEGTIIFGVMEYGDAKKEKQK